MKTLLAALLSVTLAASTLAANPQHKRTSKGRPAAAAKAVQAHRQAAADQAGFLRWWRRQVLPWWTRYYVPHVRWFRNPYTGQLVWRVVWNRR